MTINASEHATTQDDLARSVEQAPESVFLTDPAGHIVYANAAFSELIGIPTDELIGKHYEILKSAQVDEDYFSDIMTTLKTGNPWRGALVSTNAEGELFQKGWVFAPIRDENDAVIHYRADAQEEAADPGMEAQLRQSQKMEAIGQLASGIAHEINTPTQYIGDNLQFFQESFGGIITLLGKYQALLESMGEGSEFTEHAESIRELIEEVDLDFLVEETPGAIERALEGNKRVAEVVRAMKEFAHPSAEEMTPTDINRAIQNTMSVARNEWKYVAEVDPQLDSNMPPVTCLPGAMNQVFLNMLVNAAHAIGDVVGEGSSDRGTITIKTGVEGEDAVIRISDTGSGIKAENLDRIFNPFFTTKDIGKGTGQGLAIAHAVVVDTHGGSLDVESEVGKGTTFIIRVPLRGPEPKDED